jgi:DNA-directed RNA polymerase subunit RPC12/RpoP
MKYKCNNCGWTGYALASDGSRDDESVCPDCGSHRVEEVKERTLYDIFYDPEGDMEDDDDNSQ